MDYFYASTGLPCFLANIGEEITSIYFQDSDHVDALERRLPRAPAWPSISRVRLSYFISVPCSILYCQNEDSIIIESGCCSGKPDSAPGRRAEHY